MFFRSNLTFKEGEGGKIFKSQREITSFGLILSVNLNFFPVYLVLFPDERPDLIIYSNILKCLLIYKISFSVPNEF